MQRRGIAGGKDGRKSYGLPWVVVERGYKRGRAVLNSITLQACHLHGTAVKSVTKCAGGGLCATPTSYYAGYAAGKGALVYKHPTPSTAVGTTLQARAPGAEGEESLLPPAARAASQLQAQTATVTGLAPQHIPSLPPRRAPRGARPAYV